MGKDIIMEDLREHCLHASLKGRGHEARWWDYMKYVHQECFGFISESCSKQAHEHIGARFADTQKCVDETFVGMVDYRSENKVLQKNAEHW